MKRFAGWLMAAGTVAMVPPFAVAHFKLLEPPSWLQENNLGDPQKLGPCGGTSANVGMPTNMVTKSRADRSCTSSCRRRSSIRATTALRWR